MLFNFGEMEGILGAYHRFSLFFLFPYVATSLPLLYYNWYPSQIFVGDTFCYFSGMTLAVVAILGHFSKTLLLYRHSAACRPRLSLTHVLCSRPCPLVDPSECSVFDWASSRPAMEFSKFVNIFPISQSFPSRFLKKRKKKRSAGSLLER